MFKRRVPATIAAVLGVAFPAAAIAAGEQKAEIGVRAKHGKVDVLERPAQRLRRSIELHVEEIRREQRRSVPALPAGVTLATLDAIAAPRSLPTAATGASTSSITAPGPRSAAAATRPPRPRPSRTIAPRSSTRRAARALGPTAAYSRARRLAEGRRDAPFSHSCGVVWLLSQ